MEIGNRIETVMKHKNFNYRTLGAFMNYSDTQIRNIIIGKSIPKVDFIQTLVRVFPDIDAQWLITGTGNMLKEENKIGLHKLTPEEVLDYVIIHKDTFRNEPKIEAVISLFSNFEQQKALQEMYDKLERYDALLKNAKK